MTCTKVPVAGLVFDMDGTLIESHAAYPLGAPAALLSALLGRPATAGDLARYHDELASAADRVTVYDGVPALLAEAARRVPLGLFTGASHTAARILLDRTGLADHLTAIVGGDEVDRPKPHPEGVLLACRRLAVAPGRVATSVTHRSTCAPHGRRAPSPSRRAGVTSTTRPPPPT